MTTVKSARQITAGFDDPVLASQRAFRSALYAFSHPGRNVEVAAELHNPPGLAPATAAFMLTMLDYETPVWLQHGSDALRDYLRFHCGCPIVADASASRFALITDPSAMPELAAFDAGDVESPERSATLIVQVARLGGGQRVRVSGPGIPAETHIEPASLRPDFWSQWQRNHALFPRGVDVLFACGASFLALPRTTKAEP